MGTRTRVTARLRAELADLAWRILWPGSDRVPVGFAPGHWYSTIPSRADIDGWAPIPVADGDGIDLRVAEQCAYLRALDVVLPTGPRFAENGYFDTGDAAIYQAILRHRRPRRVVEVGAGWSTAACLDAGTDAAVTVIDPDPSRVRAILRPGDLDRCTIVAERLQDVGLDVFRALGPGDVLFVDSTHVGKLGSDVNRLLFEILPRLGPDVAVHFHDVRYPFEYPAELFARGRAWNEAYLLRAFLTGNEQYEIMLWADLLHRQGLVEDAALAAALDRAHSASIWIRRR